MLGILFVNFREGLEAFLVVAITLMYLRQTERTYLTPAVYASIGVSLLLCAALGLALARTGAWTPLAAGMLSLLAAVLIFSCLGHVMKMGRQLKQHINAKLGATSQSKVWGLLSVFLFVMLMISREGIEAATTLAAMSQQVDTRALAVGGLLGLALAGGVGWLWIRLEKRLNLTSFFRMTAVFLVVFAVQLLVYAFHEFTELDLVPGLDNGYWHYLTEPYGPEGRIGSWVSYSMALLPVVWLLLQQRKLKIAGAPNGG